MDRTASFVSNISTAKPTRHNDYRRSIVKASERELAKKEEKSCGYGKGVKFLRFAWRASLAVYLLSLAAAIMLPIEAFGIAAAASGIAAVVFGIAGEYFPCEKPEISKE